MLDIAVAGHLKVGFGTTMIEMDPQAVKEVGTCAVALPGISDGGAHTKFVTTARFATELLGHWVREHEIMSLEEAHWRLSAYPAMAVGLKDRGFARRGQARRRHRLRPRHASMRSSRSDASTTRPENGGSSRRRSATTESSSTASTTFIDGECTDATPGTLLRHGSAH